MNGWTQFLLLFIAGGLGTLSRFGVTTLITRFFAHPEPWGTAVINILGCFCFGLIAESFQLREHWNLQTRIVILTGFFGAFTTFSTYMYELQTLFSNGSVMGASLGFVVQNSIGFLGLGLGILLARNVLTV